MSTETRGLIISKAESVSWGWKSSDRWEDEPGAKLYFPPFSAQTEARTALSFRENIQRPQLEMNFTINDLSTQILPLMTQFPDNFLFGSRHNEAYLFALPSCSLHTCSHKNKPSIVADSHSFWLTLLSKNPWVKLSPARVKMLWPSQSQQLSINLTPIHKYTTRHHPALGLEFH